MTWDPIQYLRFADQRLQPALDLLARIPIDEADAVVDLGAGTGNVTALLRRRFPAARIIGVDNSPEMLARARDAAPEITWTLADIADFSSTEPADLLFSNAALHWLDNHASLFPRLASMLDSGGVLAVQMPHNHAAPSHTAIAEIAAQGRWASRLLPLLRPSPVADPAIYYDILRPLVAWLDIWETEYLHVLEGDDPVVNWTRGTALKPLVDAPTTSPS